MDRADLQRAIDAHHARALVLMNDLAQVHAGMPDQGVDPLPEERALIAAIDVEHEAAQRLAALLRDHDRRLRRLGVAGMTLGALAVVAAAVALAVR